MAGFNVVDPNSLPGMLARQPGLVPGPALAAFHTNTAFRPPAPMGMGNMAMPQAQQGFGLGDGIQAAHGLLGMKPYTTPPFNPNVMAQQAASTYGTLTPAGMTSTSAIDRGANPGLGSIPGNDAMPQTMMGQPDFWTGLLTKLGLR